MANGNTSFGYLLPTREMVMAPGDPDFASMIDLSERAEEFGFGSVWCGDSEQKYSTIVQRLIHAVQYLVERRFVIVVVEQVVKTFANGTHGN